MRDVQSEGVNDLTWIEALVQSREPWTVITRDLMRREWQLVQNSNLTWFLLHRGWASLPYWELSWKLVKAWPDIIAYGQQSPGRVFRVQVNGRIRLAD